MATGKNTDKADYPSPGIASPCFCTPVNDPHYQQIMAEEAERQRLHAEYKANRRIQKSAKRQAKAQRKAAKRAAKRK